MTASKAGSGQLDVLPGRAVTRLRALARPGASSGWLMAGSVAIRCTLGKTGSSFAKHEGDGKTPRGTFRITGWHKRPGARGLTPPGGARPIGQTSGWCDDMGHPAYNRRVTLPIKASCEKMLRTDGKYDVVGVLNYNTNPRVRGRGSAIFLHINDSALGTEGCIAISSADMRRLLPRLSRTLKITM